jgi:GNAT superfamily N-acetyltransferase
MPPPLRAAAPLGISYRPETEEDRDFVVRLYGSTRAEELALTGWPPEMQVRFIAQQEFAQNHHLKTHHPDAEWLLIERGGERAGRLYLEERATEYWVIDIALLPQFQGQGIGTAVLRDVLDQARAAGKRVSLKVLQTNDGARRLYLKLGFGYVGDTGLHQHLEWRAPGGEA